MTRAQADGHTLFMPALGNVVLQPLLSKNGGAEQRAKLRPVGMVSTGAQVPVADKGLVRVIGASAPSSSGCWAARRKQ